MEKELRIGNIVYGLYDDENGKQQKNICEILALDSTSSLGDGWWAIAGRLEGGDTEEYDDFKPIPLTEEWLLKFGCKKQKAKVSDYTIPASEGSIFLLNWNDRV